MSKRERRPPNYYPPQEPAEPEPERQESTAELLAEAHIITYAYDSVGQHREHNLLSAALQCGCPHCIFSYFSMLDYLTQNARQSDQIASSHGLSRPSNKKVDYGNL